MLKIRAVGLTVVNGKWLCDYTNQGMAARQRALDRGDCHDGYCRTGETYKNNRRTTVTKTVSLTLTLTLANPPCSPRSPKISISHNRRTPATERRLVRCPPETSCPTAPRHPKLNFQSKPGTKKKPAPENWFLGRQEAWNAWP